MIALQHRDAVGGVAKHAAVFPPRVYAEDPVQTDRINRSRALVAKAVDGREGLRIIELGCGTADITGPFSDKHCVHGYDCNLEAMAVARQRFPNMNCYAGDMSAPIECDILIMCEFLEHLPEPGAMVSTWLPFAQQVIISHPIDGDLRDDASAGEHQWSLSAEDFKHWFELGGHEIVEQEQFQMACYQIALGRGRKRQ